MNVVHGGDVWQAGVPAEYLDFSANLNPDGPPEWVRTALAEGLSRAQWYPDPRSDAALRGMSAHLGLPRECLLLTAGGIEAAALAARLPGPATVFQPTFQEYARLLGTCGAVDEGALPRWTPLPGETLWLCNPNNPTGRAHTLAEIKALLARAEAAGGGLVVDEAFIDYCPEHSAAGLVPAHPALVVLGSLTKSLAIPGVRLGYLAAHPTVIRRLSESVFPWRLNCLADAVAAALPGHEDDFARIRSANALRRAAFARMLSDLGAEVFPSEASFLLCDFHRDMRTAVEALRQRKVLLRPCGMFPGLTHGHVRLCVRTKAENERLIEALKEVLS